MHSSGRIAAVILGLGLILPTISPQEGPPSFKTGVTVANVPVTVRGHGICALIPASASFGASRVRRLGGRLD
jgi:hypothetical protein